MPSTFFYGACSLLLAFGSCFIISAIAAFKLFKSWITLLTQLMVCRISIIMRNHASYQKNAYFINFFQACWSTNPYTKKTAIVFRLQNNYFQLIWSCGVDHSQNPLKSLRTELLQFTLLYSSSRNYLLWWLSLNQTAWKSRTWVYKSFTRALV